MSVVKSWLEFKSDSDTVAVKQWMKADIDSWYSLSDACDTGLKSIQLVSDLLGTPQDDASFSYNSVTGALTLALAANTQGSQYLQLETQ